MSSMNTATSSRFQSTYRDPLWKYKQQQCTRFAQMYDYVKEQTFIQPLGSDEKSKQHSIQESILEKSVQLNSTLKLLEQVDFQSNHTLRKRIFDPNISNKSLVKSIIQQTQCKMPVIQIEERQSKEVQTSFYNNLIQSIKDKSRDSSKLSISPSIFHEQETEVTLINKYDTSAWMLHNNWMPNYSESRFRYLDEDYQYNVCHNCHNFMRDNISLNHNRHCSLGNVPKNDRQELLIKFNYLLHCEVKRLRDYNAMCKETRVLSCVGLEITKQLINIDNNINESIGLQDDFKRVSRQICGLSNMYTRQIVQLFQGMSAQL